MTPLLKYAAPIAGLLFAPWLLVGVEAGARRVASQPMLAIGVMVVVALSVLSLLYFAWVDAQSGATALRVVVDHLTANRLSTPFALGKSERAPAEALRTYLIAQQADAHRAAAACERREDEWRAALEAQAQSAMSAQSATLRQVTAALDALCDSDFGALRADALPEIASHLTRCGAHARALVAKARAAQQEAEGRSAALLEEVDALKQEVGGVAADLAAMERRLAVSAAQADDARDATTAARERLTALCVRVDAGAGLIGAAVEAMSRIKASAKDVNAIVDVLDEITFQTNLLALNAGVEAARAGEAGRGFAVVAAEVRALAQRSSLAAKDIRAQTARSTCAVEEGVGRVKEMGEALTSAAASFAEVSGAITKVETILGPHAAQSGRHDASARRETEIAVRALPRRANHRRLAAVATATGTDGNWEGF